MQLSKCQLWKSALFPVHLVLKSYALFSMNGMTTEQLLKCRLWNKKGALFPVHLFFREGNSTLDVDTSILYGMFERTSFDWAGGTSEWGENKYGGAFLFSITNILSRFEQFYGVTSVKCELTNLVVYFSF